MRSLLAAFRLFHAVRWSMARIASRSASIAARLPMSLSDISLSGFSGGGGAGYGMAKGLAWRPWVATTLGGSAASATGGVAGAEATKAPCWGGLAGGAEAGHGCAEGGVGIAAIGSPA